MEEKQAKRIWRVVKWPLILACIYVGIVFLARISSFFSIENTIRYISIFTAIAAIAWAVWAAWAVWKGKRIKDITYLGIFGKVILICISIYIGYIVWVILALAWLVMPRSS